jgi:hypothetical protein
MLQTPELERVAAYVYANFREAKRGAMPLNNRGQQSVIVYGNDGYSTDEKTVAAVAKTRASLVAAGYTLGEVATEPKYRDTWVFEVAPQDRTVGKMVRDLEDCDRAVWDGWAEARGLDSAESDPYRFDEMGSAGALTSNVIDLSVVLKDTA